MSGIISELKAKYPEISYGSLINSLTISRFGKTKIIEVSYNDNNPIKIKYILDALAKYYLDYSFKKRQTKLNQGLQFVEKELPTVKKRVDTLQQQLQLFRQQNEFFDPETNTSQISTQIASLTEQQQTLEKQLVAAKAIFVNLQGRQGAVAALKEAPVYQQLISQLRQLETEIAGESTRFREDAPIMQRLKEKRQKLLPLLQQEGQRFLGVKLAEAASEIQNLEIQAQELAKTKQILQQQIQQLPVLTRRYAEFQQNLQIANESLNRFLTTRQNLQIEIAQTELPWEMIKAAIVPENPVSPNIPRNLILGFVASGILGIGAALLREKLDNTYHSVDALKDDLKLPLLGALPIDKSLESNKKANSSKKESSQDTQLLDDTPEFSSMFHPESTPDSYFQQSGQFVEAVRVIHTNLQMLSSDRQVRSIVVSSALPGDGKSTVAYNLAQVAASMG
ncbi:MAG: capsular biosynthesis protein, partial [Cyanobacteria bacterium J06649_11]